MFLNLVMRPVVRFDATNPEHREHYANFLKIGSWGSCPVRFEVTDENSNNNLAYAMQRMLTEYYVLNEFKGKPKTPKKLVRQKKEKTVDKQAD